MRTVQMTLDDELVRDVDHAARKMRTTRSAFTRDALHRFLEELRQLELEQKHREGYQNQPVTAGEFDGWEDEQVWGDS